MKRNNVLVVDDERNILNSLERLLVEEPFGVCVTTGHKEALDIIEKEEIKTVMLDYRMPEMNGVELLKKIKDKHPDIIRILFSGYTDIKMVEDAINAGEVYRFINKPWDPQDLKITIRDALEKFDLIENGKQFMKFIEKQNKELKVLADELKKMYESQKEFSSTVSHELRTPLACIKTAIDILKSGTPGKLNVDQEDFLKKAGSNIDRLQRIINDVLDFSKFESGGAVLNFKENDINEVVKGVVDANKLVAEKKDLFLKFEVNKDSPKVVFDADKIEQVLYNMVGNAIKSTDKGGVMVAIVSNEESNYVKVCVEDTGWGIRKEDFSKLFKKFQQLGDPEKKRSGGTGLGLAICKTIIDQHNGKIEVESEMGKGTKFCFTIPIRERRKRKSSE